MALNSASGFFQTVVNFTATQNLPASSLNYPPYGLQTQQGKKVSFSTGGNIPGGINEIFLLYVTIAPGGSATINLQNLQDILGNQGVVLVRLKMIELELVAVADDATNGTNASSVTVGNAGSNPHGLFLDSATGTFTLQNGQPIGSGRPDAAGYLVSGAANQVKFSNNDGVNSATVRVMLFGATL